MGRQMENWASELMVKAPSRRMWVLWFIKPPVPCGCRGVTDGTMEATMEGSEVVQRATALIEQRLAEEEENEVGQQCGGLSGI